MWQDGKQFSLGPPQEQGISLEGGDPVVPFLPTDPLGCLLLPPAGMGVPPVQSGDVRFAQRDGVVQFADYYEPRVLTFQVLLSNDGCPGCPSVRQKWHRLSQEWSRSCDGASLAIFTDCHNPDATEEEKQYLGPYLVRGRPRVADIDWQRSNRGVGRVTLRFDAEDARLMLMSTDDFDWHADHVVTVELPSVDPVPVEVVGNLCAFGVFTLTGQLTAPIEVFTEDPDGVETSFTYSVTIPGGGDPVVVDTQYGVATSGGVEVTINLSGDYASPLAPGTNLVRVETGNPADTGTVSVEWQNAVVAG